MKKADLIAVGEFMNSLLDPPGLNINGDLKALKAEIHESLKFLEPEDEIPEEIAATIRECNFEFPDEYFEAKEGEDPINKDDVIIVLQKQGIWVNLEDGDGITDVEPVDDSLEKAVEEAETLKDCRELVKANDVFKPLRNGLAGYKLIRKLKEEMLALLVPEEEPKKEEEPAKEKKETKKPASSAKKETKKPAADKKDKGAPSNKEVVYLAWKAGETDLEKLHKKVKEGVRIGTIKSWLSAWSKDKNLPAVAKK
jgi:hypothetical protein